jgi:hypothetical protein
MLLISGGQKDFNLTHLAEVCVRQACPAFTLYLDEADGWYVNWSLDDPSKLYINDQALTPKAVFVRWDAFSFLDGNENGITSDALNNWFDLIKGWALVNPSVKVLNRFHEDYLSNKPFLLKLAYDCGLDVPKTYFTNNAKDIDLDGFIAKPIAGGAHTENLADKGGLAFPMIVQEKLINPEMRIYRIGDEWFAFQIESAALDYRTLDINDISIHRVPLKDDLVEGLKKLTDQIKLDYAAADFKTCPKTGKLKFLEINSMPMFGGFDLKASGALSHALLKYLLPQAFLSSNKLDFSGASG